MPQKFIRTAVGTGWTAIDSISGMVDATLVNDSGVEIRLTDAANATDAASNFTAGIYMGIASNSSAVWTGRLDPSRTFVSVASAGANPKIWLHW
jgi:hypothetical protein